MSDVAAEIVARTLQLPRRLGGSRATVLRHALLAFLFNVAIIAMTINVIAGLV